MDDFRLSIYHQSRRSSVILNLCYNFIEFGTESFPPRTYLHFYRVTAPIAHLAHSKHCIATADSLTAGARKHVMQTSLAQWLIPKTPVSGTETGPLPLTPPSSSHAPAQATRSMVPFSSDPPACEHEHQPEPEPERNRPDEPSTDSLSTNSPPGSKHLPEPSQALPTKPQINLHKNITLVRCTASDLPALKRLNTLFPIQYPARFYTEILTDPVVNALTLVAHWTDDYGSSDTHGDPARNSEQDNRKLVGAIRCRLAPAPAGRPAAAATTHGADVVAAPSDPLASDTGSLLYISTLIVSPAFRTLGIATALLAAVTSAGVQLGADRVGAHVWIANDDARRWYAARGFREVGVEDAYYRRLDPRAAVVVERRIGVLDHLAARDC